MPSICGVTAAFAAAGKANAATPAAIASVAIAGRSSSDSRLHASEDAGPATRYSPASTSHRPVRSSSQVSADVRAGVIAARTGATSAW